MPTALPSLGKPPAEQAMRRLSFTFLSKQPNPETGVNESWIVTSASVAKGNSDVSPYLIPNEVICGSIAQFLQLPVPPFALMKQSGRHKGHKVLFASLRFTRKDSEPDDFRPDVCFAQHPELCAGILLFDVFVANEDRHVYNVQTDSADRPKMIRILDHDRAIFGSFAKQGAQRLERLWDRLGTSGGSMTAGGRNCLINHIKDRKLFDPWYVKIQSIPDWFINETCASVRGLGATRTEVQKAAAFLNHRKRELCNIVYSNREEFRGIKADDWGLIP